jgi:hypothetical protein
MTPIALGARPSNVPHPAGKPFRHPVTDFGTVGFPGGGSFMVCDPGSGGSGYATWWQGQLGPYNLPTRFWLVAGANWICLPPSSPDWNRYDVAIYLLVGGSAYSGDLLGQGMHQNADSMPGGGYFADWMGNNIEARFYCEANTTYHPRFLAQGGGAGNSYYRSQGHIHFWAYTVGEGVY